MARIHKKTMRTASSIRLLRWTVLLVLLGGFTASARVLLQNTESSDWLKITDDLVKQVARVRSLEPKSTVQKGIMDRDEISRYLHANVRENLEEGKLKRTGAILRKLGLISPDEDYEELILELLTEQVGGYYDVDKRTLFVASWLPIDQQRPILVHELAHALQDQHFDLNRILKEARELHNDDGVLARQAVIEGDATAVMLDYLLLPSGRRFPQLPDLAFVMRSLMSVDSQFHSFKKAPMYLKETLLFPYGYGAAFLQRAWEKSPSWSAVNTIYSDLPVSTEQIIHPEKYLYDRDDPKTVEAEDISIVLGRDWRITYKNVLGEFSLFLLLRLHLPEEQSKRASAGWGGDQVLLLENDKASQDAVYNMSVWDSVEDAEDFYRALKEWFQHRSPGGRIIKDLNGEYSLARGGQYHQLKLSGTEVRFLMGLPESEASKFGP